jgi:hypothetical protein
MRRIFSNGLDLTIQETVLGHADSIPIDNFDPLFKWEALRRSFVSQDIAEYQP